MTGTKFYADSLYLVRSEPVEGRRSPIRWLYAYDRAGVESRPHFFLVSAPGVEEITREQFEWRLKQRRDAAAALTCPVDGTTCGCKPEEVCEEEADAEEVSTIKVSEDGYRIEFGDVTLEVDEPAEIAYEFGRPVVTVKLTADKVTLE